MRPSLVAFGNVLLDSTYSIEKNTNILTKYGFDSNALGECSSETLSNLRKDAHETCDFVSIHSGGSALNTCKMLSILGESEIVFCGSIGNDSNGVLVRQNVEQSELKLCLQVDDSHPTGSCVCLINKEDRCCYANIGASINFDVEFLKSQRFMQHNSANDSISYKQFFYVEGFFITNRFPVCKYIVEEVCGSSESTRIFATNLSAEYLVENNPEHIKYIAEHASILFGNRGEFNKLAEIYRMPSALHVIAYLMDSKTVKTADKTIICTQGAGCVLYSSTSKQCTSRGVNLEFRFDAIPEDKILDTTGCGDAFVAGYLYALLKNEWIERCVAKGVEVAHKKITSVGGTFSK